MLWLHGAGIKILLQFPGNDNWLDGGGVLGSVEFGWLRWGRGVGGAFFLLCGGGGVGVVGGAVAGVFG